MISHNDQVTLFEISASKLKKDISCYAFGGTAMMFYGYKDETKDIDLSFENKNHRDEFIRVIESLGFSAMTPFKIYNPEKLLDKNRPLMYKREDIRIDIFCTRIFKTRISPMMKEDLFAIHDFKSKHNLRLKVLRKEHIVLLKVVTERQADFDDIQTIIERDSDFDWEYLINEAIWQGDHGDSWVLLNLEKTMQELKKFIFIPERYFKMVYQKNRAIR